MAGDGGLVEAAGQVGDVILRALQQAGRSAGGRRPAVAVDAVQLLGCAADAQHEQSYDGGSGQR